jgi:hypothetical protein
MVELEVNQTDSKLADKLMSTSWSLATIAAWCAILELNDQYNALSQGAADNYKNVCAQLWHPTSDWHTQWYFRRSLDQGETEAPYALLPTIAEMQQRMADFIKLENYDWAASSPTRTHGYWALDFIACRHFRVPVPASEWYRFAT